MMTKSVRTCWILGLVLLLCAGNAGAQAFVEVENQGEIRRVDVQRIQAKPNGELVLFREGADPITVKPGQYRRAVGVKPEEIDQAAQLMAQERNDQAAALLQRAMQESRFQSWDTRAGAMLVDLQLEEGNSAAASATLRQLKQTYGDNLIELFPEVQMVDWKVRIATGSVAGLQEDLTKAIQSAETSRPQKAMAQLVRGDLKTRREDFESAVLDYLRTAYFYPDVTDVHAEALYKTASTFARLGDAVRANRYQQMLKSTHPDSTFAGKPIGN
jgi:lipopolysaccharide biosynthesis regulator YciM